MPPPFFPLLRRNLPDILTIGVALGVLAFASTVQFYSANDQIENIYGGMLITRGIFPYSDFFSQHLPLPHLLSAALAFWSHGVLWVYQALFTTLLGIWAGGLYIFFKKHAGALTARTFLALIVAGTVLVRSNHFLAETLIAYASITLLLLFLYRYCIAAPRFTGLDVLAVSLLTFLIAGSSLLYAAFAAAAVVTFGVLYLRASGRRWPAVGGLVSAFLIPYVLLGLFLLATHGLSQFIFDAYTFNREFYAQFAPYPHTLWQWGVNFLVNFPRHIADVITDGAYFLRLPDLALTLGAVGTIVLFWRTRAYAKAALIAGALFLLVPRNDFALALNTTTEVFHGAPYAFVAAGAVALLTGWLWQQWGRRAWRGTIAMWHVLILLVILLLVTWTWDAFQFSRDYPDRRIRPTFSAVVNELLTPEEYFWSGPALYPDVLTTQARFGSRYLHFFPWQGACATCMRELLDDLQRSQPKVVIFETRGLIWQTLRPGDYVVPLLGYLHDQYYQLPGRYNPYGYFYFRRDVDAAQAARAMEEAAAQLPADTIFD